ncbi:unnamed protein product [Pichia kudriavzevii]
MRINFRANRQITIAINTALIIGHFHPKRNTTMHCLADVAITPIGPIDSIEKALELAKPLLEASGQEYVIHDGGFTIDAEWKDAMTLVGQIHEHLHKSGFVRVHSDMRVGTRTDKAQTMQDKINVVEKKLKQ